MKLGCMAGVEYKDKIVFSSTYINGLFELDMNTRKVQFIKMIEGETWEAPLFRKAFLSGKEAWFIPQRGNHVICVNLNTYDIKYFELQYNRKFEETIDYSYYFAYIDGIIVNEKYLYCIPNGVDSLLVIDLCEHSISSISGISNPKQDLIYTAYFYQGKLNLLSQKGKLDKTICIESNSVEKKEWKFDSTGFLSSVQTETDLYLIPAYCKAGKQRKLAQIDLTTSKVAYIDMPDNAEEYYGGLLMDNYLMLLPDCGTNFLKIFIKEGISEKVLYPDELKGKLKNCNNTARIIVSNQKKLISLIHSGYILEFDKEGNISDYFDVEKVLYLEAQKVIKEYKKKGIILPPKIRKEEENLSLSEYIQLI